jgi:hypothetical protein
MQRCPVDTIQTTAGDIVAGAEVTVYIAGTPGIATIYNDDGITTTANPITSDMLGQILFYAANGRYDLVARKTGYTDIWYRDILLEDPTDGNKTGEDSSGSTVTITGGNTARTLATRFSDTINILDYGADATGVADSGPALQSAINAANGRQVYVPPGTFRVSTHIFLMTGTVIIGVPLQSKLIPSNLPTQPTGHGGKPLFSGETISNVYISGLVIDAYDLDPQLPAPGSSYRAFWFTSSHDFVIDNCWFRGPGSPTSCVDCHSYSITNNTIYCANAVGYYTDDGVIDSWTLGADVHDVVISHNFIDCGSYSINNGILFTGNGTAAIGSIKAIEITNNIIQNGATSGIWVNGRFTPVKKLNISDNIITNINTLTAGYHGIVVQEAIEVVISNNIIDTTYRAAIRLSAENAGIYGTYSVKLCSVIGNVITSANNGLVETGENGAAIAVMDYCLNIYVGENLVQGSSQTYNVSFGDNVTYAFLGTVVGSSGSVANVRSAPGTNIVYSPSPLLATKYGQIISGYSGSIPSAGDHAAQYQVHSNYVPIGGGLNYRAGLMAVQWSADVNPGFLNLGKSRSNVVGTNAVVLPNDTLGQVRFIGDDGAGISKVGSYIRAVVTSAAAGTIASNLEFAVTLTGGSAPVNAITIVSTNGGEVRTYFPFGYVGSASVGGAVTQLTNKSTGVTLNKICGQITMNNAALAAATAVAFTLTNSLIQATDTVIVNIASGGTVGAYTVSVAAVGTGSCSFVLKNESAGPLSEAVVLGFAVIKAAVN